VTSTASTSTTSGVHGPVDFVLLEFPRDRLTGAASQALADLVESGVIRLYDLLVISKDDDGGVEVLELGDPSGVDGFAYFSGARSGLLGDEDVEEAASAMQPGTVAALIVYENSWAIPFVAATRGSGGELIASARIPAPVVMEALEAIESSESA
jgi:dihydroorotase-like cyclic amidohydrolase